MKKFIFGFIAGAATAYLLQKLINDDRIKAIEEEMNDLAEKAKQSVRGHLEKAQNEVEYLGEQAEAKSIKVSQAIGNLKNKI